MAQFVRTHTVQVPSMLEKTYKYMDQKGLAAKLA